MTERVWKKPTKCGSNGCDCIEVSVAPNDIWVRNSKDPNGTVLKFNDGEWNAFVHGAKDGEFDL